ncbi:MAG: response regulator transcription factor [Chloroflexi bacterium]|nr:MAG: response regulator transcription factor [Chloroflexota bacterium]
MSRTELSGDLITYSGADQPVPALAIVADRRLSAAALSALLLKDPSYQIARREHGVDQVRAMLARERPSVMVLDVHAPALFALLDASDFGVRMLLLLDPDDDPSIFAGARSHGYLSRRASREALQAAIAELYRSGAYLDPLLMRVRGRRAPSGLSLRERQILVWIASGRSTKEVARACAITPKTVGNHVNNMVQKLHLRHRGQLVIYAAQQGLTTV